MKKPNKKQIAAAAIAVVVAGAAGVGAGFMLDNPEPQVFTEVQHTHTIEQVPFFVNQTVEVPVEKIVEKEVLIEVPAPGSEELLEFIVDEDGDLEMLDLDRIEDYGFDELINQVAFIRESKVMAADFVKKELADEVDRRSVGGVTLDEDDIERIRVQDDIDEMLIEDVDFEDMDAFVTVFATFEHDDIEYEVEFEVEIRDGEVDSISIKDLAEA